MRSRVTYIENSIGNLFPLFFQLFAVLRREPAAYGLRKITSSFRLSYNCITKCLINLTSKALLLWTRRKMLKYIIVLPAALVHVKIVKNVIPI